MPTTPKQLIIEAKRLQRLQTRRRKAKKELKAIETEIKLVRKHIRALAAQDPDEQLPPEWADKLKVQ